MRKMLHWKSVVETISRIKQKKERWNNVKKNTQSVDFSSEAKAETWHDQGMEISDGWNPFETKSLY